MHNKSDSELLLALKEGEHTAFQEIYKRYSTPLLSVAYSLLKDVGHSEDILHEVFARIWINRETISITNLGAYLSTSVRSGCYRLLDRSRRVQLPKTGNLPEATDSINSEAILDAKLLEYELQKEICRLPEKCRLVFQCYQEEKLTSKELAQRFRISESAVENHLFKARGRLRRFVESLFLLF